MIVYKTYVVTMMEYIAQLHAICEDVLALGPAALHKLAPGPDNWIAWSLCGLPNNCKNC